tara:strand:+ start:137 stop:589 length:453 start_codon:yes stop_codon:yes gene_type:complete
MVCETHLRFLDSPESPSNSWQCFVRQENWSTFLLHHFCLYKKGVVVLQHGASSAELCFCDRVLEFGQHAIANVQEPDGSFVVVARDTNEEFRVRMKRSDLGELTYKVGEQPKRAPIFLNDIEAVPALWHVTVAHRRLALEAPLSGFSRRG